MLGQGGGQATHTVQCRNLQVRGHDTFHTAVDEVPEGREFHRGERAAVGQDARQGEVGVEVGVAVARGNASRRP